MTFSDKINGNFKHVLWGAAAFGALIAGAFGGWKYGDYNAAPPTGIIPAPEHRLRLDDLKQEQKETNRLLREILQELKRKP